MNDTAAKGASCGSEQNYDYKHGWQQVTAKGSWLRLTTGKQNETLQLTGVTKNTGKQTRFYTHTSRYMIAQQVWRTNCAQVSRQDKTLKSRMQCVTAFNMYA